VKTPPKIRLHKDTNRVSTEIAGQAARRDPDAALPSEDHRGSKGYFGILLRRWRGVRHVSDAVGLQNLHSALCGNAQQKKRSRPDYMRNPSPLAMTFGCSLIGFDAVSGLMLKVHVHAAMRRIVANGDLGDFVPLAFVGQVHGVHNVGRSGHEAPGKAVGRYRKLRVEVVAVIEGTEAICM
jgi:hypothetical protein